jgi:hypothetical protein
MTLGVRKNWGRGFGSWLTLCFFVANQIAFAAPHPDIQVAVTRETPNFLRVDIPADLASLDGLYEAPPSEDSRVVLHIQNAHANYEAQQKIKKLLGYLHKNYDIKTIFVEGAAEDLNSDYFRFFPDEKSNLEFADGLARKGELTGAELYLLAAKDSGVEGKAIEDAALYRQNYEALKKVFGAETLITHYLEGYEAQLEKFSSKIFTNDIRKILAEWKKFEKGHREFIPFVNSLVADSRRFLGLDLESLFAQVEWPQVTRLLVLQSLEKDLDSAKALKERDKLLEFLQSKGITPRLIEEVRNFKDQRVNVRQGTGEGMPPRDVLEALVREAGPKGFNFRDYPSFSLYAGYLILKSELDSKGLFEEIKLLFDRILKRLAETPHQKTLLELYQDAELVRKLLGLELTRQDWQDAVGRRDLVGAGSLLSRLRDLGDAIKNEKNLGDNEFSVKQFNPKLRDQIAEVYAAAFRFYEFARQRESIFYEKIDSVMKKSSIRKAVLITGGFHTDGMTDLFRQHAVSYGVLMPRFSDAGDESLYRKGMLQSERELVSISYLEMVSSLQRLSEQELQGTDPNKKLAMIVSAFREKLPGNPDGTEVARIFNDSPAAKANEISLEYKGKDGGKDAFVVHGLEKLKPGVAIPREGIVVPLAARAELRAYDDGLKSIFPELADQPRDTVFKMIDRLSAFPEGEISLADIEAALVGEFTGDQGAAIAQILNRNDREVLKRVIRIADRRLGSVSLALNGPQDRVNITKRVVAFKTRSDLEKDLAGKKVVFIGGASNAVENYETAGQIIEKLIDEIHKQNPESVIMLGTTGFGIPYLVRRFAGQKGMSVVEVVPQKHQNWVGSEAMRMGDGSEEKITRAVIGTDWSSEDYYAGIANLSSGIFIIDGYTASEREYEAFKNLESHAFRLLSGEPPSEDILSVTVRLSLDVPETAEEFVRILGNRNSIMSNLNEAIVRAIAAKWDEKDLALVERLLRNEITSYQALDELKKSNKAAMADFDQRNGNNAALKKDLTVNPHTAWFNDEVTNKPHLIVYGQGIHNILVKFIRLDKIKGSDGQPLTVQAFENPEDKFRFSEGSFVDAESLVQFKADLGAAGIAAPQGFEINTVAAPMDVLEAIVPSIASDTRSSEYQTWIRQRKDRLYRLQRDSAEPLVVSVTYGDLLDRMQSTSPVETAVAFVDLMRAVNIGWRLNNAWKVSNVVKDAKAVFLFSSPFGLNENDGFGAKGEDGIGMPDILKDGSAVMEILRVLYKNNADFGSDEINRKFRSAMEGGLTEKLKSLLADKARLAEAVRESGRRLNAEKYPEGHPSSVRDFSRAFSTSQEMNVQVGRTTWQTLAGSSKAENERLLRIQAHLKTILTRIESANDAIMARFEGANQNATAGGQKLLVALADNPHENWRQDMQNSQGDNYIPYNATLHAVLAGYVDAGKVKDRNGKVLSLAEFEHPQKKFKIFFGGQKDHHIELGKDEEALFIEQMEGVTKKAFNGAKFFVNTVMGTKSELAGVAVRTPYVWIVNEKGKRVIVAKSEDKEGTGTPVDWQAVRAGYLAGLQRPSVASVLSGLMDEKLLEELKTPVVSPQEKLVTLVKFMRKINLGWRLNNPWNGYDDDLIHKAFELDEGPYKGKGIGLRVIMQDGVVLKAVLEALHQSRDVVLPAGVKEAIDIGYERAGLKEAFELMSNAEAVRNAVISTREDEQFTVASALAKTAQVIRAEMREEGAVETIPIELASLSQEIDKADRDQDKGKAEPLRQERLRLAMRFVEGRITNPFIAYVVGRYLESPNPTDVQQKIFRGGKSALKEIGRIEAVSRFAEGGATGWADDPTLKHNNAQALALEKLILMGHSGFFSEGERILTAQGDPFKPENGLKEKRLADDPRFRKQTGMDGRIDQDKERENVGLVLGEARALVPVLDLLLKYIALKADLQEEDREISRRPKGEQSTINKINKFRDHPEWGEWAANATIADLFDLLGGRIVVSDLVALENLMKRVEDIFGFKIDIKRDAAGNPVTAEVAGGDVLRKENKFITSSRIRLKDLEKMGEQGSVSAEELARLRGMADSGKTVAFADVVALAEAGNLSDRAFGTILSTADPYRAIQYTIRFPDKAKLEQLIRTAGAALGMSDEAVQAVVGQTVAVKDTSLHTFELQIKTERGSTASDLFHDSVYKDLLNLVGELKKIVRDYNWNSFYEDALTYGLKRGLVRAEDLEKEKIRKMLRGKGMPDGEIEEYFTHYMDSTEVIETAASAFVELWANRQPGPRNPAYEKRLQTAVVNAVLMGDATLFYDLVESQYGLKDVLPVPVRQLKRYFANRRQLMIVLVKKEHPGAVAPHENAAHDSYINSAVREDLLPTGGQLGWRLPPDRGAEQILTPQAQATYRDRFNTFLSRGTKLSVEDLQLHLLNDEQLYAFFRACGKVFDQAKVDALVTQIRAENPDGEGMKRIFGRQAANGAEQLLAKIMLCRADSDDARQQRVGLKVINLFHASRQEQMDVATNPANPFYIRDAALRKEWLKRLDTNQLGAVVSSSTITEIAYGPVRDLDGNLIMQRDPATGLETPKMRDMSAIVFTADAGEEFTLREMMVFWTFISFINPNSEFKDFSYEKFVTSPGSEWARKIDVAMDQAIMISLVKSQLEVLRQRIADNGKNPALTARDQELRRKIVEKYLRSILKDPYLIRHLSNYFANSHRRQIFTLIRGDETASAMQKGIVDRARRTAEARDAEAERLANILIENAETNQQKRNAEALKMVFGLLDLTEEDVRNMSAPLVDAYAVKEWHTVESMLQDLETTLALAEVPHAAYQRSQHPGEPDFQPSPLVNPDPAIANVSAGLTQREAGIGASLAGFWAMVTALFSMNKDSSQDYAEILDRIIRDEMDEEMRNFLMRKANQAWMASTVFKGIAARIKKKNFTVWDLLPESEKYKDMVQIREAARILREELGDEEAPLAQKQKIIALMRTAGRMEGIAERLNNAYNEDERRRNPEAVAYPLYSREKAAEDTGLKRWEADVATNIPGAYALVTGVGIIREQPKFAAQSFRKVVSRISRGIDALPPDELEGLERDANTTWISGIAFRGLEARLAKPNATAWEDLPPSEKDKDGVQIAAVTEAFLPKFEALMARQEARALGVPVPESEARRVAEQLNTVRAIQGALAAQKSAVVIGAPGTGKTELNEIAAGKIVTTLDLPNEFWAFRYADKSREELSRMWSDGVYYREKSEELAWLSNPVHFRELLDKYLKSPGDTVMLDEIDLATGNRLDHDASETATLMIRFASELKKAGKKVVIIVHPEGLATPGILQALQKSGLLANETEIIRTGYLNETDEKNILNSIEGLTDADRLAYMSSVEGIPAAYMGFLKYAANLTAGKQGGTPYQPTVSDLIGAARESIGRNYRAIGLGMRNAATVEIDAAKMTVVNLIDDLAAGLRDGKDPEVMAHRTELLDTGLVKADGEGVRMPRIVRETIDSESSEITPPEGQSFVLLPLAYPVNLTGVRIRDLAYYPKWEMHATLFHWKENAVGQLMVVTGKPEAEVRRELERMVRKAADKIVFRSHRTGDYAFVDRSDGIGHTIIEPLQIEGFDEFNHRMMAFINEWTGGAKVQIPRVYPHTTLLQSGALYGIGVTSKDDLRPPASPEEQSALTALRIQMRSLDGEQIASANAALTGLLKNLRASDKFNEEDLRDIGNALVDAMIIHRAQKRREGSPYFEHLTRVVERAVSLGVANPYVIQVLALHDALEDQPRAFAQFRERAEGAIRRAREAADPDAAKMQDRYDAVLRGVQILSKKFPTVIDGFGEGRDGKEAFQIKEEEYDAEYLRQLLNPRDFSALSAPASWFTDDYIRQLVIGKSQDFGDNLVGNTAIPVNQGGPSRGYLNKAQSFIDKVIMVTPYLTSEDRKNILDQFISDIAPYAAMETTQYPGMADTAREVSLAIGTHLRRLGVERPEMRAKEEAAEEFDLAGLRAKLRASAAIGDRLRSEYPWLDGMVFEESGGLQGFYEALAEAYEDWTKRGDPDGARAMERILQRSLRQVEYQRRLMAGSVTPGNLVKELVGRGELRDEVQQLLGMMADNFRNRDARLKVLDREILQNVNLRFSDADRLIERAIDLGLTEADASGIMLFRDSKTNMLMIMPVEWASGDVYEKYYRQLVNTIARRDLAAVNNTDAGFLEDVLRRSIEASEPLLLTGDELNRGVFKDDTEGLLLFQLQPEGKGSEKLFLSISVAKSDGSRETKTLATLTVEEAASAARQFAAGVGAAKDNAALQTFLTSFYARPEMRASPGEEHLLEKKIDSYVKAVQVTQENAGPRLVAEALWNQIDELRRFSNNPDILQTFKKTGFDERNMLSNVESALGALGRAGMQDPFEQYSFLSDALGAEYTRESSMMWERPSNIIAAAAMKHEAERKERAELREMAEVSFEQVAGLQSATYMLDPMWGARRVDVVGLVKDTSALRKMLANYTEVDLSGYEAHVLWTNADGRAEPPVGMFFYNGKTGKYFLIPFSESPEEFQRRITGIHKGELTRESAFPMPAPSEITVFQVPGLKMNATGPNKVTISMDPSKVGMGSQLTGGLGGPSALTVDRVRSIQMSRGFTNVNIRPAGHSLVYIGDVLVDLTTATEGSVYRTLLAASQRASRRAAVEKAYQGATLRGWKRGEVVRAYQTGHGYRAELRNGMSSPNGLFTLVDTKRDFVDPDTGVSETVPVRIAVANIDPLRKLIESAKDNITVNEGLAGQIFVRINGINEFDPDEIKPTDRPWVGLWLNPGSPDGLSVEAVRGTPDSREIAYVADVGMEDRAALMQAVLGNPNVTGWTPAIRQKLESIVRAEMRGLEDDGSDAFKDHSRSLKMLLVTFLMSRPDQATRDFGKQLMGKRGAGDLNDLIPALKATGMVVRDGKDLKVQLIEFTRAQARNGTLEASLRRALSETKELLQANGVYEVYDKVVEGDPAKQKPGLIKLGQKYSALAIRERQQDAGIAAGVAAGVAPRFDVAMQLALQHYFLQQIKAGKLTVEDLRGWLALSLEQAASYFALYASKEEERQHILRLGFRDFDQSRIYNELLGVPYLESFVTEPRYSPWESIMQSVISLADNSDEIKIGDALLNSETGEKYLVNRKTESGGLGAVYISKETGWPVYPDEVKQASINEQDIRKLQKQGKFKLVRLTERQDLPDHQYFKLGGTKVSTLEMIEGINQLAAMDGGVGLEEARRQAGAILSSVERKLDNGRIVDASKQFELLKGLAPVVLAGWNGQLEKLEKRITALPRSRGEMRDAGEVVEKLLALGADRVRPREERLRAAEELVDGLSNADRIKVLGQYLEHPKNEWVESAPYDFSMEGMIRTRIQAEMRLSDEAKQRAIDLVWQARKAADDFMLPVNKGQVLNQLDGENLSVSDLIRMSGSAMDTQGTFVDSALAGISRARSVMMIPRQAADFLDQAAAILRPSTRYQAYLGDVERARALEVRPDNVSAIAQWISDEMEQRTKEPGFSQPFNVEDWGLGERLNSLLTYLLLRMGLGDANERLINDLLFSVLFEITDRDGREVIHRPGYAAPKEGELRVNGQKIAAWNRRVGETRTWYEISGQFDAKPFEPIVRDFFQQARQSGVSPRFEMRLNEAARQEAMREVQRAWEIMQAIPLDAAARASLIKDFEGGDVANSLDQLIRFSGDTPAGPNMVNAKRRLGETLANPYLTDAARATLRRAITIMSEAPSRLEMRSGMVSPNGLFTLVDTTRTFTDPDTGVSETVPVRIAVANIDPLRRLIETAKDNITVNEGLAGQIYVRINGINEFDPDEIKPTDRPWVGLWLNPGSPDGLSVEAVRGTPDSREIAYVADVGVEDRAALMQAVLGNPNVTGWTPAIRQKLESIVRAELRSTAEEERADLAKRIQDQMSEEDLAILKKKTFKDITWEQADTVADAALKIACVVHGILRLNQLNPEEAADRLRMFALAVGADIEAVIRRALPEDHLLPISDGKAHEVRFVTTESYPNYLEDVKVMLILNPEYRCSFVFPDSSSADAVAGFAGEFKAWAQTPKFKGFNLADRVQLKTVKDMKSIKPTKQTVYSYSPGDQGAFSNYNFAVKLKNQLSVELDYKFSPETAAAATASLVKLAQKAGGMQKLNAANAADIKELLKDLRGFEQTAEGRIRITDNSLAEIVGKLSQEFKAAAKAAVAA